MSVPLLYLYVMALFERTKRLYGFPRWCSGKESACQAGDVGLIRGKGRYPGEKHGNHSNTLAWKILWTEEPGG